MDLLLAKLFSTGNLNLKGEIIEIEANWNDVSGVDETFALEDTTSWDDYLGVENFIGYIINTDETWVDIPHFHFRPNDEHFYTNNFIEDSTITNPMKVNGTNGTVIKGTVTENIL
jgi:hypothetical protein